ncbi:hypothetical protein X769_28260 [Mesorhizobium sp. LSJC268A00]|nr:hypothetical protein X769_28260 [Mesorhizobium sp. LSJC268A00]
MYDLLLESELLRHHVATGKVAIGINHEMRDFAATAPRTSTSSSVEQLATP